MERPEERLFPLRTTGRGRAFLAGLALCLVLVSFAHAQDKTVSLAFVGPGRLAILGPGGGQALILSRMGSGAGGPSTQVLGAGGATRYDNATLKKDRTGNLYLVWEEPGPRRSGVGFGRISASGSVVPGRVRLFDEWNGLPDLGFDAAGHPWLTWVGGQPDARSLYVEDTVTGRVWRLASASAFLAPRLVCDGQGSLRVFWGETGASRFRLISRAFKGLSWSPAVTVRFSGPFPIESFDAAVDEAGTAWVVWSELNGKACAVCVSREANAAWSAPAVLSTNAPAQNIGPSVAIAEGVGPVVSWVRSSGGRSVLCLRVSASGQWGRETVIPGVAAAAAIPQVAVESGSVGLAWIEHGQARGRIIPLARLIAAGPLPPPLPPGPAAIWDFFARLFPFLLLNPDLGDSSYIGFGDSITYGVINSEYHPELGYIPRLEALLTSSYGASHVDNEGVGSEITANGLARLDGVLAADLARYILVLEGTNDTITKIYNPDVTQSNLELMVGHSRGFGTFPAMGTLLPRFDDLARPDRVQEVNTRIHSLAGVLAVPLVDFFTLFNDYPSSDGGVMSLLSDDKLHPNEKGYQFMAQKWFEAIRDFPFPPVDVQVRREYDKLFFFQNAGNTLTWSDNAKIFDKTKIQEYRLYRKLSNSGDDAYALLAVVQGSHQYFDSAIASGAEYTYVISAVTTDGAEGPASAPVTF